MSSWKWGSYGWRRYLESCNLIDRAAGKIEVVRRRIDELKLDPKNPRTHSAEHENDLAGSLATFGFVSPAVIDAGMLVLAGTGRIRAARKIGWTTVTHHNG